MTEAQAAWLRKLRDEGPQRPVRHEWTQLRASKKSAFITWGPEGYAMSPLDAPPDAVWLARITPAGLAALTPEPSSAPEALDQLEERTCTCGAGHGSGEGHTNWCDWTCYMSLPSRAAFTPEPEGGPS